MRIRSSVVKKLPNPSFAVHHDFDSMKPRTRGHSGAMCKRRGSFGGAQIALRPNNKPNIQQHLPRYHRSFTILVPPMGHSTQARHAGRTGVDGFEREEGQSCAATVPVLLMVAKVCVASYNLLIQDKELECVHGTYSNREGRCAVVRCGSGIDTFENV